MRWRVLLFGVLLAALCAPPGFAGTWTASQIGPSQSSRYEWSTVDDSTKTLDATHCGAVAFGYADDVSGGVDTAASAELLSCKKKDAAQSECTTVATFTSDSSYNIIKQRPGYYHVNVLTAPGGTGQARIDAYCALDLGSSGGADGLGTAATNAGPFTVDSATTAHMNANSVDGSALIDASVLSGKLAAGVVLPTHVVNRDPVSGTDACIGNGESWTNSVTGEFFTCTDAATDTWIAMGIPFCSAVANQLSTTDNQIFPYASWGTSKILAFGCQDGTTAFSGITTPYNVQLKLAQNGNAIGSAANCSGKDQQITWTDVSGDADGTLASGSSTMTDVTNSPIPSGSRVLYCLIARPQ